MQSCPSCGTELPDSSHFCGHCGYPLSPTVKLGKVKNMRPPHPKDSLLLDDPPTASPVPTFSHKVLGKLPMPIQQAISTILSRAGDTKPELSSKTNLKKAKSQAIALGSLPVLTLTSSLGLFTVAIAYNIAHNGSAGAEFYFWLGLLLIFVPSLVRLISPKASRFERISLLCVVATCLYIVKVMLSPLYFSQYDEFLHWRTVNDIARTGHLFSINTLLPISPLYPGLEIVTHALSSISGLSTLQSGILVVGVARLVLILAFCLLIEQITGSARIASIATILYMTNPHFLFFDAQFAYESLALPLAIFVLFAVTLHESLQNDRRWIMLFAWIVLGAVVVTHHLTNFIFDGLLLLWTIMYAFLRPVSLRHSIVVRITLVGIIMTVLSIALIGNPVVQYFSSFFKDIGSEIGQALTNSGDGARHLFVDYSNQPTSLWERAVALFSVALITLCIPFSLLCLWKRYRNNALAWVFGIVSLFYSISQLLRLTNSGAEASDRASAFIFIAVSCVLAIFIIQFWPIRWLNWKQTTSITCAISVIFMGGIILGAGTPPSFLPGPYQVSADARSIEQEGIQAAIWAHAHLGSNNRMATDRVNQLLMSTYGDQHLVTPIGDNVDVTDVFFSPTLGSYEISLLKRAQVRYLVVDLRLSSALPEVGYYFEQGEPEAYQRTAPIDREYLTKFDSISGINRVFDSGDIVIYDIGGLINAPEKP